MARIHKAFAAQVENLGERQVRVVATTGDVDRTGEQVVQNGLDIAGFVANPIILWQHDPDYPIGSASEVQRTVRGIEMLIEFAPPGISAKADEICGLVKAGVIKTVSIGFDPIETEPMNPRDAGKKNAPQRYLSADLMETSFVSIPANKGAVVTQRQHKSADGEKWTCEAATNLDIDVESSWDGREAAARILEWAGFGGDSPDPDKAKAGFLAYDAAGADLKGSYKLPFADVKDGKLVAVASGIRACASRLPDTDIPASVKKDAGEIIDGYEEKIKAKENKEKSGAGRRVTRRAGALVVKDLYDVANLAYLLNQLGWQQSSARIEAALEGDASKLPDMLASVMQDLGAALVAMTQEEVAEALKEAQGSLGEEEDTDGLDEDEVTVVTAGKTPMVRRFRAAMARTKRAYGVLRIKAGRKISADTADKLRQMQEHHDKATEHMRAAMREHTKSMNIADDLLDGTNSAGTDDVGAVTDDETGGAEKTLAALRTKAAAYRAKAA